MTEKPAISGTKSYIKGFLGIYLPVCIAIIFLSWIVYRFHFIKTQSDILRAQEINLLGMQKELINQKLQSIIADIKIISENKDLKLLINEARENHPSLTRDLISFSKYKGIYDQIRVLDGTGMEIVRVDLRGGQPFVVPEDQLQYKGKRYYFTDTFKLGEGEIFMSPFDLNVERGEIENPRKPMIRFGTPLFDEAGSKTGIFMLNYLGDNLIEELTRLSLNIPGRLILLNNEGYWLKGLEPEDEWGFMYRAGHEKKFEARFPEEWLEVGRSRKGQILTDNGLFTFNKIYPLQESIKSSSGSPEPYQQSARDLSKDEYFWTVLSYVPTGDLNPKGHFFLLILGCFDFVLFVGFGFITWNFVVANGKKKSAEEDLKNTNRELEDRVRQRTFELENANKVLQEEIEKHVKTSKEKMEVESRLRQAQKMEAIGTLAGGIAHDFNNILAAILGFTELALDDLPEDSPLNEDLMEVYNAGKRARDLVGQILTFSRQREEEISPIQITPIVKEALKLLRSTLPTTIEIRQSIEVDLGNIMGDPTEIHQIVMNLCTNAGHAMRENGGIIEVNLVNFEVDSDFAADHSGLQTGKYIRLSVSDTGHGMAPEVLNNIFDPYFTTKRRGEGTGLGLAVVHGIVQTYGGVITVQSETGKGTVFDIFLPEVEEKAVAVSHKPEDIPRGDETILFVDDEKAILSLGERMLKQLGYHVVTSDGSEEALALFQASPDDFDLVITDMTMPHMTGDILAQKLMRIKPDLPVILHSGFSEKMTKQRAEELGIKAFIVKPLMRGELAFTIRKALDGS